MMAADAAIQDNAALRVALSAAYKAAKAGYFVTFGIKPTAPETGYGYIEVGPELEKLPVPAASTASSRSPSGPAPSPCWRPAGICGIPVCSCSPQDPAGRNADPCAGLWLRCATP